MPPCRPRYNCIPLNAGDLRLIDQIEECLEAECHGRRALWPIEIGGIDVWVRPESAATSKPGSAKPSSEEIGPSAATSKPGSAKPSSEEIEPSSQRARPQERGHKQTGLCKALFRKDRFQIGKRDHATPLTLWRINHNF
ncbi:hypothetical protein EJ04DRAFT_566044 [Polyplosphaeria fusca]|uniref:Uncharacterized protein n=1 Tax=Polyplosphaeria fusca TaxID=682080 RepID=A0A9P4QWR1_9PLEO|nr:hypothetical protein EJ04DRAFT_566044 [Polyplosphaeria fusca]